MNAGQTQTPPGSESVRLLVASTDPQFEAALVSAYASAGHGITVVRRCVDLPDLLAVAATGVADMALVSDDLRRFDREAVHRLAAGGVRVVALAADEAAERRMYQLGAAGVVLLPSGPDAVAVALYQALGQRDGGAADAAPAGTAERPQGVPGRAVPGPDGPAPGQDATAAGDPLPGGFDLAGQFPDDAAGPAVPVGFLVAVWGPTGAPGRTTVALGVAAELAEAGRRVLLVDADPYGGSVAQYLGLLEESPGLAAAARAANSGALDAVRLAVLAREIGPNLRVLTGITRASRWTELRASGVAEVLRLARLLADVVIVDCGFCLEQDEELVYDTTAPRRNAATVTTCEEADLVLAVGSADPVGLARLVRGLAELRETVPGTDVRVVLNRVRGEAVAGDARAEVTAALARHAAVTPCALVPMDSAALDRAHRDGRLLPDVSGGAAVRQALRDVAQVVEAAAGGEMPAAPGASRRQRSGRRKDRRRRNTRVPSGHGT